MTEDELADIERLDRGATRGPWARTLVGVDWGVQQATPMGFLIAQAVDRQEDADLMAAARTLLPKLAAEVRALRADLASEQTARAEDVRRLNEALNEARRFALQRADQADDAIRRREMATKAMLDLSGTLQTLREKAKAVLADRVESGVPGHSTVQDKLLLALAVEVNKP